MTRARRRCLAGGLFALVLCAGSVRAQEIRPVVRINDASSRSRTNPTPEILAAELQAHVETLAGDDLEGRETGSLGGLRAALYIAQSLAQAGVAPALPVAPEGSTLSGYLADIGYVGFPLRTEPRLMVTTDAPEIDGEAVFTGAHGVDFDYVVGAPAEGELELFVVSSRAQAEAVKPLRHAALYIHGSYGDRQQWLEVMGSPGGRGWGALLLPGWPTPGDHRPLPLHGVASSVDATLPVMLRVRGPLRKQLSEATGGTIKLGIEGLETTPAYNVIGVIPGQGTPDRPELAREVIVFTAHYDHIGIRGRAATSPREPDDPAPDDLVFNGADDDASGVAGVLELAHAFAHEGAPARTLVFLLVTGEEKGLLGTEHYLDHPVFPLADTVYNLNLEMIGRPDPTVGGPGRLWVTGPERTNVMGAMEAAGIGVGADMRPEQNFFQRSDNIAFVRRGVPAQTFSSYALHEDYHRVTDEAATLDPDHMQAALRELLRGARMLAQGELDPVWLPGGNPYAPADAGAAGR